MSCTILEIGGCINLDLAHIGVHCKSMSNFFPRVCLMTLQPSMLFSDSVGVVCVMVLFRNDVEQCWKE
jgi:hypothetical protein